MPKPEKRKLYTKFMMIGYEIPTAKSDPGREYTLDLNSVYKNKDRTYTYTNYLHVPDTVRNDDARIRLKRLAGVVDMAKSLIQRDDRPDTLKIFMAPEFFFRPEAKITQRVPSRNESGFSEASVSAYTEETYNEIYRTLATMFSHPDFADWVFIPGSIVYVHNVKSLEPLDKDETSKLFVRNQTMVVRGGRTKKTVVTVVDKVNVSPVDQIDKDIWRPECCLKDLPGSLASRKKAIFNVGNVRFGLEICMDHDMQVLKRTIKELAITTTRTSPVGVDIHLLPANSQELGAPYVAARNNGYILREDGTLAPDKKPYTQIGKVTNLLWEDYKTYKLVKQLPPKQSDEILSSLSLTTVNVDPKIGGLDTIGLPYELKIDSGKRTAKLSSDSNEYGLVSNEVFHPQRIALSIPLPLPR